MKKEAEKESVNNAWKLRNSELIKTLEILSNKDPDITKRELTKRLVD